MEPLTAVWIVITAYVSYKVGHNFAVRRIGWGNMKGGWRRWRSGRL